MPNRRLSLRKIKEILRLKLECGISEREISRSCQVSRSTIADYLRRATAAKLTWKKLQVPLQHIFHPVVQAFRFHGYFYRTSSQKLDWFFIHANDRERLMKGCSYKSKMSSIQAAKSAFCCGGKHQHLRRRGFNSFF